MFSDVKKTQITTWRRYVHGQLYLIFCLLKILTKKQFIDVNKDVFLSARRGAHDRILLYSWSPRYSLQKKVWKNSQTNATLPSLDKKMYVCLGLHAQENYGIQVGFFTLSIIIFLSIEKVYGTNFNTLESSA